jgi:hypothetical protein
MRIRPWGLPFLGLASFLLSCGSTVSSPDVALRQVTPGVVCGAQEPREVQVLGEGFTPVPIDTLKGEVRLELPKIFLAQRTAADGQPGDALERPLDDSKEGLRVRFRSDKEMRFDVYPGLIPPDPATGAPASDLPSGLYDVVVQNPDGRRAGAPGSLAVVPPPSLKQVKPLAVCALTDASFELSGAGFLKLDGALPTITFTQVGGSGARVSAQATEATGCTAFPAPSGVMLASCSGLTVTVPRGMLPPARYRVTVTNPAAAGCRSREDGAEVQIDVVDRPTLTDVAPRVMCSGDSLRLTGSGFYSGGTVFVGADASSSLQVNQDATQALASFPGPIQPGGPYDVTMRNTPGCEATLPAAVRVIPGPAILFVDPPAVPNLITIQATLYATGIPAGDRITSVSIARSGTGNFMNLAIVIDPARLNRALITIPAGLPPGSYDVRLTDESSCAALLRDGLKVVETPTLGVSGVTPAFGSAGQDTAAVIAGTGFVSTPRAYLSRSDGGAGVQAQALGAVTFSSGTSLTAVVRQGLPAGAYDLVVVNPDGGFGLLRRAFTVTAANAPPPVIQSVAPSSFVTGVATDAAILGSGFRAPAVRLTCFDAAGATVAGAAASVTSSTDTRIQARLTAVGLYCLVRVTNQDGTYFDYSAVGVTNASLNLTGFRSGANLTAARRALAAAAGRPTAVARYVYALGGDSGADASPRDTIEAAPTSLNGDLGAFFPLNQRLPKALSFLGAVTVGRFLYVVGGFDGTAASRSVYRAELLSPLRTPAVTDVDVVYDRAVGLGPGVYTYRISAVIGTGDDNNPGGETLASDFFPVQLPQVTGKLQLVLLWSTVPNATSYRIYRSSRAGDAAGGERLIGTVAANATPLQFIDNGAATAGAAAPLPLGSIGAFRAMPSLATARLGAGVAAVRDPGDATKYYLYAAGGNSGTPSSATPLSSVERLTITIASGGNAQTTSASWSAAGALPSARWLGAALAGTSDNNSLIPANAAYLYVSSGSGMNLANADRPVYVAQVGAGGALGAFADTGSVGVQRPATGGVLVNNQVMAFGGMQAGAAQTNSDSARLSGPTSLANFNSLGGGVLKSPRALQGTALESAFIYQLGGASAAVGTAQASTEQAIW